MTAVIGMLAVLITAIAAAVLIGRGYQGLRAGAKAAASRFRLPVLGVLGGATLGMAALEFGILRDDFSIEYIANNSASVTPLLFKVAAGWASLEGSILLWGLVLAVFIYTVYRQMAKSTTPDQLGAGALAVLGVIALFFFGMMLTVANPFRVCIEPASIGCIQGSNFPWVSSYAPLQGSGPNPLLQNHFLMAAHPPLLYIGYVGMSVPFAFAMSALMLTMSGAGWLKRTRSWTLVAWGFLTVGIIAGGLWSYEVLGWGGYWAWDPVENASFMPWLIATAFLHSSIVQERRGMLQSWNFVLVITAFALTILGTFLTRSGVVASVHSFSQSAVGPVLLWFLMVVLIASFGLFAARAQAVASSPRLDSVASREGVFLLNNLLLAVFTVVVLVGTLYPMFIEAFTGSQVGVGRPFYDRMAIPLSYGLLLAMGVGPLTPWRLARGSIVWERIKTPVRVALAGGAVAVVLNYRNPFLLLGILAATFVVVAILRNLYVSAKAVSDRKRVSLPAAVSRVVRTDAGYWGGQLSHLGVAVIAFGIAFSANLAVEATVHLTPGDTATVAGYDIKYVNQFTREEPHRAERGAEIEVRRNLQLVSIQEPRLNQFPGVRESVAKPAVYETLRGDLYLSLKSIGPDGVTLGVWWFPFIWMVWAGGFLTGAAALWSRFARRPARAEEPVAVGSDGES